MFRLQELRTSHGLSQADIGELLGVTRSIVSKWERGRRVPLFRHLKKLADLFGCSIESLMEEE
jgi:transcriptional regulator with XRE-family HTH domain